MLHHTQKCTEAEARRQLQQVDWSVTLEELDAFVGIMYARGASGAKGLSVKCLWDSNWGIAFCQKTMARNSFLEIMKFLRFDMKSTRSTRF